MSWSFWPWDHSGLRSTTQRASVPSEAEERACSRGGGGTVFPNPQHCNKMFKTKFKARKEGRALESENIIIKKKKKKRKKKERSKQFAHPIHTHTI